MVNTDPEPTGQTSQIPCFSPRKTEPSLSPESPATPRKVFCQNQWLPSVFSASPDQPDVPRRRFLLSPSMLPEAVSKAIPLSTPIET